MTPTLALTVFLVLGLGLLGLFVRGDSRIDDQTRRTVAQWLGRRTPQVRPSDDQGSPSEWTATFLCWFDRVFGVRRVEVAGIELFLPRLWRSIVASFLALLVLCVVWVLHKETMSRLIRFGDPDQAPWDQFSLLLLLYGGATLITNWIPDYLSLIQSRWIMQRMATSQRRAARLGWLAVDAVLTASIAFAAIFVGMKLLLPFVEDRLTVEIGCFSSELFGVDDAWEIFVAGLRFETPPGTLNYDAAGIYIYSTFMTSLWVWIYGVVGLVVRATVALGGSRGTQAPARRWERRPLTVMGLVALVGFGGVFWTSWLLQGAWRTDVVVVFDTRSDEPTAALVEQLRRTGLRVEAAEVPAVDFSSIDDADARQHQRIRSELATSLERAELVVVVQSGARWAPAPGLTEFALELAEVQSRRGERPSGTVRVWMPEAARFEGFGPSSTTEVVEWAQHAPSLLSFDQLRVCRERWPAGRPRR